MRKDLFLSFLVVLFSTIGAFSQPTQESHISKGYGYVYGGPGATIAFCDCGNEATVAIGGGGEGLLKGGFGLGIDGGYFFVPSVGAQYGIGLVSPSALYQFKTRGKTNPFVLGGYTLAFRGGVANLVHFGGGVNHWLGQHWGLRLEVRYLMSPQYPGEAGALQFRVGALIR
ncbi:MAG TPA: hypothetical protein VMW38_04605 [Terriglobia bacterium]|nr:hypothetical protein [Terriglobia bacterium]